MAWKRGGPTIPNISALRFEDIKVLNVGQANFVIGENRNHIMDICFDCGFDQRTMSQSQYSGAYFYISKLKCNHLIVLSHFDLDHFLASSTKFTGGKRLGFVYSTWVIPDPMLYITHSWTLSFNALSLLAFLLRNHQNQTLIFGRDLPDPYVNGPLTLKYGTGNSKNAHSIVSALTVGSRFCVMPGDAPYEAWSSLFTTPIDFLIVPHHGYRLSKPNLGFKVGRHPRCFVCCGVNPYGDPNFAHFCVLHRLHFKRVRFANRQSGRVAVFLERGGATLTDYCSKKIKKFYYIYH